MKKILLYTLMTVAAAGMTACEDFLTRDTYDQIGSDEFWKSETDLEPVSYTHLDVYKRQLSCSVTYTQSEVAE